MKDLETTKTRIMQVFGITHPQELSCLNAETAIQEIFSDDYCSNPTDLLTSFVANCSPEQFAEIKQVWLNELKQI